jgi:arsenate reductase (glutaredoxin)
MLCASKAALIRIGQSRNDAAGTQRMSITIYGIKNCDTMKKAFAFLDKAKVDYAFHDYKKAGIDKDRLERWSKKVGWETLLNRAGMTFRKLPEKDKEGINESKAMKLMLAQPSMIKRPVLDLGGGKLLVGFMPDDYKGAFAAKR